MDKITTLREFLEYMKDKRYNYKILYDFLLNAFTKSLSELKHMIKDMNDYFRMLFNQVSKKMINIAKKKKSNTHDVDDSMYKVRFVDYFKLFTQKNQYDCLIHYFEKEMQEENEEITNNNGYKNYNQFMNEVRDKKVYEYKLNFGIKKKKEYNNDNNNGNKQDDEDEEEEIRRNEIKNKKKEEYIRENEWMIFILSMDQIEFFVIILNNDTYLFTYFTYFTYLLILLILFMLRKSLETLMKRLQGNSICFYSCLSMMR